MTEKRKLTPFLAHEMLFDFATEQLDPDRRAAVAAFVVDDRESQNLLAAIRRGLAYAESLKAIELTEECLMELDQAENLVSLSKRIARWSEWPDSLRWSIIAVGVSVSTAALVVLIPWKSMPIFRSGPSFDSGSIEIARVEPRPSQGNDPNLAANLAANLVDEDKESESGPFEGSGDEEFSEEASGAIPAQQPVLPDPNSAVAAVSVAPTPSLPAARIELPQASPVNSSASPVSSVVKSSRSFVYRAFMTLGDLEDIAPKITQQIKELGAEKAGEVELGWRRGSGRYYHFTIPELNEQKLLDSLRVYGPVRISKDPHPRVMPEGQVRFILWIESGA